MVLKKSKVEGGSVCSEISSPDRREGVVTGILIMWHSVDGP